MMKKSELLAPCGDYEIAITAINNGARSIYLGGNLFNARKYATNFSLEEIKDITIYAHKAGCKVFVTLNILIKDSELDECIKFVEDLYNANIDGIIIQDYGLFSLIANNFDNLIISMSTQCTIDDLEGASFFAKQNAKRVVLARECDIERVKEIKENLDIEVEVFAHGALCVCYSGQCLLSEHIGKRSGNRGMCAQPCRKPYRIYDVQEEKFIDNKEETLLSLKDLNTLDNLQELLKINIDSLKIEGRMKNKTYVANVVKAYRNKIDNYYDHTPLANFKLEKTFNRCFTKGYLFHEDVRNLKTLTKVNNAGYLIGKVTNTNYKGYIEITLNDYLCQNDIIRIENKKEDVSIKVVKLYNEKLLLSNKEEKKAYLKIKEKLNINDPVYKTFDYNYEEMLNETSKKFNHPLSLDVSIIALINKPLEINLKYLDKEVNLKSSYLTQKASKHSMSEEDFKKQIKLGDSFFKLNKFKLVKDGDVYVPNKEINELRRKAIFKLEELLSSNYKEPKKIIMPSEEINSEEQKLTFTFLVRNKSQKEYLNSLGYYDIYDESNTLEKVNNSYDLTSDLLLVRNYGGIEKYQGKNLIIDYSLNVFNHLSAYYLFKNGAKVITPSLELNDEEMIDLAKNYKARFNSLPNLEYVCYHQRELMISKYCPLRFKNMCGKCKKELLLCDSYSKFPLIMDKKCQMHLLQDKPTNKIKSLAKISKYFKRIRFEFNFETNEEIKKIIDEALKELHQS